eukprot:6492656-Amphidinium_carterae.4
MTSTSTSTHPPVLTIERPIDTTFHSPQHTTAQMEIKYVLLTGCCWCPVSADLVDFKFPYTYVRSITPQIHYHIACTFIPPHLHYHSTLLQLHFTQEGHTDTNVQGDSPYVYHHFTFRHFYLTFIAHPTTWGSR